MTSAKPEKIKYAEYIMKGSLIMGILYAILQFDIIGHLRDTWYTRHTCIVMMIALTSSIIYFLIVKISQGSSLARIIFLLLSLSGVLPAVNSLLDNNFIYTGLVILIQTTADIVVLILIFSREANNWFKLTGDKRMMEKFK